MTTRPINAAIALVIAVALALDSSGRARADAPMFGWPLRPRPQVATPYDPPDQDWLPGHRGVDLNGTSGQPVLAAGPGTVVFAGVVAGRPVMSIDHRGGTRTTYEPVEALLEVGRTVQRGEQIGTLRPGHDGCASACLHWGVRRGRTYLNPLALVGAIPIRLLPMTTGSR